MITSGNLVIRFLDDLSFQLSQADDGCILARGEAALRRGRANGLKLLPESRTELGPQPVHTVFGDAERWTLSAEFALAQNGRIRQVVTVERYPDWPDAFLLDWRFENTGAQPLAVQGVDCPRLQLGDWIVDDRPGQPIWSFQGAAVKWGQDFAFPLPSPFKRDNFLGHLDGGEGGGIPLTYFWTPRRGLALAHLAAQPKEWYMPVRARNGDSQSRGIHAAGVEMGLQLRKEMLLSPGEALSGLCTLIARCQGDFFVPLALYRTALAAQGLHPAPPNAEDYEPAWCSWGYEFDVRPADILGALPAVKDLGMRWLTLDDRWFDAYGDWNPRSDTFPGGAPEMRDLVDRLHQAGAYAQLWWYPLAVEDGIGGYSDQVYGVAEVLRQNPDGLILNLDGSPARNNRGLAILCPALLEVQQYIASLTRRFVQEWGFDGHKLDNIYTVPACHNPAHHHQRPEESVEALAEVYRIIFETTRSLKPYSVTQICPCGTPPTFSLLPYMDQAVTADPINSAQIRQRIKFYKALLGPYAAVFADHVELSDGGLDFASEIGTGGIPATKFLWPVNNSLRQRLEEWWPLTPEKLAVFQRWLAIYCQKRLAEGEYLNLYDLAFDSPEAHVIRKDGSLYYAFYAGRIDQRYAGAVKLRGMQARDYQIQDYVHGVNLGIVRGPEAELLVQFDGALLIEVTAVKNTARCSLPQ